MASRAATPISSADLLRIKGFGPAALREVKAALAARQLHLGTR